MFFTLLLQVISKYHTVIIKNVLVIFIFERKIKHYDQLMNKRFNIGAGLRNYCQWR